MLKQVVQTLLFKLRSATGLSFFFRGLLGLIFLAAGAGKIIAGDQFSPLAAFPLLPPAFSWAGSWLPWAEILLGTLLVMGLLRKVCYSAALLFVLVFVGTNISSLAAGNSGGCDCFGSLFILSDWQSLILDALMLFVILLILQPAEATASQLSRQGRLSLFFTRSLAAVLTAALVFSFLPPASGAESAFSAGENLHPVMRPSQEQLARWAEDYNSAPSYNVAALQAGEEEFPPYYSLLSFLEYDPVERDQGYAGNCWVWAGTGVVEVDLAATRSVKERLSIQYFDSSYPGGTDAVWAGCGGDLSDFARFYNSTAQSQNRVVPWSNTNAAYADYNQTCENGTAAIPADSISVDPHFSTSGRMQVVNIPTTGIGQAQAIANIKSVLLQNKAVFLGFYLSDSADWQKFFNFWSNEPESAIWDPGYSCGHDWDWDSGGGHGVVCVGYNDADPDNAYWLMLNSWGTTAERPGGLFRLSMNLNYDCSFNQLEYPFYSFEWQTLENIFPTSSSPAIILSETSGETGDPVTVNGSGFAAQEDGITVTFDGTPVVSGAVSDFSGSWNGTFEVPFVDPGQYLVQAYGSNTTAESVPAVYFTVVASVSLAVSAPETVTAGSTFAANITLDSVIGLKAFMFDFSYDRDVLSIPGNEGGSGVTSGIIMSTRLPLDKWEFVPAAHPGKIRVQGSLSAGVSGGGYLAQIRLKAKGLAGQSCSLVLSNVQLLDEAGTWMAAEIDNADVSLIEDNTPAAVISLDVPSPQPRAAEFGVDVLTTELTGMTGFDLRIAYDPAVIVVTGVNHGKIGATVLPVSGWGFLPAYPPNTQGTLRIYGYFSSPEGISGSGYLARVRFRVVGEVGQHSDLHITKIALADKQAEPIPLANPVNGQVSIVTATGVIMVDCEKADGIYNVGEIIDLDLIYSGNITVETTWGVPALELNSGGSAVYNRGSGSNTLTFRYTVEAGQGTPALDYTSRYALQMNGGMLLDDTLKEVDNTLPPTGNLTAEHHIAIDTALPVITAVSPSAARQGQTVTLVITGSHFSGASEVGFSKTGITVNSININPDCTRIEAVITLDKHAAGGDREVWITSPAGSSQHLVNGFSIDLIGDVNGDHIVNIGDVIFVELIMLDRVPETPGADVNADGRITIGDVIKIELIMLEA